MSKLRSTALPVALLLSCSIHLSAQQIDYSVPAGTPLRVYLTKRLPKRAGEAVHAKLLDSLFALDHEVAPAGSEVLGIVRELAPVSKGKRATALLGGDLTPLHRAEVEFTTLVRPDGSRMSLETRQSEELNSLVSLAPAKKSKPGKVRPQTSKAGVLGIGKQQVKSQVNRQITGWTRGLSDLVRGPDKKERLEEFLLMKLPYHPQWVRNGTRYDAILRQSLPAGHNIFTPQSLTSLGSQPPPDSTLRARILTPLNSATATRGERVDAIVEQPMFAAGMLVLPEGTHLIGAITSVRPARWFHRGGQLRFNFEKVELPPELASLVPASQPATRTSAVLDAVESTGKADIKVDQEGSAKAAESNTRFIAPLLSYLIAAKAADEPERGGSVSAEANTGARTLGGAAGLGVIGAAAAQASRNVGTVLGFYRLGLSVYTNMISRGGEVEFSKDSLVDVRFGSRH